MNAAISVLVNACTQPWVKNPIGNENVLDVGFGTAYTTGVGLVCPDSCSR